MLASLKLWTAHFLDYIVDCKILQHRCYWFCQFVSITLDSWWGEDDCPCKRCCLSRDMKAMDWDNAVDT